MTIELGHFALNLALAIVVVQSAMAFIYWRQPAGPAANFVRMAAVLHFILVATAFGAVITAFVNSDFSLWLAVQHSNSAQPLIYRITSVWGNHEGSMLLWVLVLAGFSAAVAIFSERLPTSLRTLVLGFQGLLSAAFTAFVLFTSNPFIRQFPVPLEGNDLNPILQDIGLALHPPLLYLGYVGFSVCFSFSMAALVSGRIDGAWARWVRPWTMISWVFLTLGIGMGSFWAYYELGWGGWWFWDPVENASFMPWLAGTALLHTALVMEKRNALKVWTIMLSILTFSLSLLGMFLVRSGILTSVHAFASDPTRGMVILGILVIAIGGAFSLFAMRASSLRQGGLFSPVSREGALILNNVFLATATAAVLTGTLYPLILDAMTGDRISVGAPFFDLTFGILMVPLLMVMPFGPRLQWKRADLAAVTQRLFFVLVIAVILGIVFTALFWRGPGLAPLGFLLAFWVMIGAVADIWARANWKRAGFGGGLRRLAGLPRSIWATAIAHFGVGVLVLGIVAVSSAQSELITTMKPGDSVELNGINVSFDRVTAVEGPNFTTREFDFTLSRGNDVRTTTGEKRVYRASGLPTTEVGIVNYGFSQFYVSLGDTS
ncbi:MAG: heme lyase CcmF/NrfE family subunit, partial [Alphaproteobacteria bacterium]|nr:heme lyase CcmF/NrfE family subunit [Alphaproteobacteria bacterium]